jgi:hypothetical protein
VKGRILMGRSIGMIKKLKWVASLVALAAPSTALAAATAAATATPVSVDVTGKQTVIGLCARGLRGIGLRSVDASRGVSTKT